MLALWPKKSSRCISSTWPQCFYQQCSSDVLKLALLAHKWLHVNSFKLAMVVVFTLQKLADTTHQTLVPLPTKSWPTSRLLDVGKNPGQSNECHSEIWFIGLRGRLFFIYSGLQTVRCFTSKFFAMYSTCRRGKSVPRREGWIRDEGTEPQAQNLFLFFFLSFFFLQFKKSLKFLKYNAKNSI